MPQRTWVRRSRALASGRMVCAYPCAMAFPSPRASALPWSASMTRA